MRSDHTLDPSLALSCRFAQAEFDEKHAGLIDELVTAVLKQAWTISDGLARASFTGTILSQTTDDTGDPEKFTSFAWPLMYSVSPKEISCACAAAIALPCSGEARSSGARGCGPGGGDAAEHAGAGDHLSPSRALPLSVDIFAGFEDGAYFQLRSGADASDIISNANVDGFTTYPREAAVPKSYRSRKLGTSNTNITYDFAFVVNGTACAAYNLTWLTCETISSTNNCEVFYALDYATGAYEHPYRCKEYLTPMKSWYMTGLIGLGWTSPYLYNTGDLGLDAVQPLYGPSGAVIGVGGASLLLDDFSKMMEQYASRSDDLTVFVVGSDSTSQDSDWKVIASSDPQVSIWSSPATAVENGLIRAVAQELVVEGYENNHENIRTITWNEREYYYESHRYGDLDGYVTRYEIETIVVPQTWHVVIVQAVNCPENQEPRGIECVKCEEGYKSDGGDGRCDSCDPGYFISRGGNCTSCEGVRGVTCDGGLSLPAPAEGYWVDLSDACDGEIGGCLDHDFDSSTIRACKHESSSSAASVCKEVVAEDSCFASWSALDACKNDTGMPQYCGKGHNGALCRACDAGYAFDEFAVSCTKCNDGYAVLWSWAIFAMTLAVFMTTIVLVHFWERIIERLNCCRQWVHDVADVGVHFRIVSAPPSLTLPAHPCLSLNRAVAFPAISHASRAPLPLTEPRRRLAGLRILSDREHLCSHLHRNSVAESPPHIAQLFRHDFQS